MHTHLRHVNCATHYALGLTLLMLPLWWASFKNPPVHLRDMLTSPWRQEHLEADCGGQKCFTEIVWLIVRFHGHHVDLRPVNPPIFRAAFLIAYNYTKAQNKSASINNAGLRPHLRDLFRHAAISWVHMADAMVPTCLNARTLTHAHVCMSINS